jgi:hypothetical protein
MRQQEKDKKTMRFDGSGDAPSNLRQNEQFAFPRSESSAQAFVGMREQEKDKKTIRAICRAYAYDTRHLICGLDARQNRQWAFPMSHSTAHSWQIVSPHGTSIELQHCE